MKTSRTLLCGYSKPFGFFLLFAMGTILTTTMASEESSTVGSQSVAHTATTEQKENAMTPSPGKHSDATVASPKGSFDREDTVVTPKQTHAVTKSSGEKKSSSETTAININTLEGNTLNNGNYRCSPLGVNSVIIILLLSLRI